MIRKIFKGFYKLSYKLGKSRPSNYDGVIKLLIKCIFSIKHEKIMNSIDGLINIEQASHDLQRQYPADQKRKLNYYWKYLLFSFHSLIFALNTFGDILSARTTNWIKSLAFKFKNYTKTI